MSETRTQPATTPPAQSHPRRPGQFALWTVIAAVVAAFAAWLSAALALEVWIMFAGFIAWFTRPTSLASCLSSMLCLWFGIGLGALSSLATGALLPPLGDLALPIIVFLAAILIV
ncbi:DUF1097 family protein, partial [Sphingomonas sp.]|uniref:DUF1097 family protein n=1 Tax=Sphingomonas sp. TaxID=28214 RepID=UPI003B3B04FB